MTVVLLLILSTACARPKTTSSTTGQEVPVGLAFRFETPIVVHVAPDVDTREFSRREKEEAGNEDRCPLCEVINGIYRMEPQKELVFLLDVATPSTVRVRLYAFGGEPDKLTAELYQEAHTRPIWIPVSRLLKPGVATINGSRDITEAEVARGSHWRLGIRNNADQQALVGIFVTTHELRQ